MQHSQPGLSSITDIATIILLGQYGVTNKAKVQMNKKKILSIDLVDQITSL